MTYVHPAWVEHQRARFMRPDAQRYWRPDADRLAPKETLKALGWVETHEAKADFASVPQRSRAYHDMAAEAQRLQTLREIAALRFELALLRLGEAWRRKALHHSQLQPRDDIGRWTDEGGSADRVRIAHIDKVVGAVAAVRLLVEAGKKAIDAYRTKELLWDMLGDPVGVVSHIEIDGEAVYGVNSRSPKNEKIDDVERNELVARVVEQNPEMAESVRSGKMPSDAFYHAETSALLRAARKHGGTLAGRELNLVVDKKICNNCETVLPLVARELGNPTLTLYDRQGTVGTIRDGVFHRAVR